VPPNARIRPLDRLRIRCESQRIKTRVISIAHQYNFEGMIDGYPLVTGAPTQITAGIDRTIPVTLHSRRKADSLTTKATPPIQAPDLPPPVPGVRFNRLTLGVLIDDSWKTRRNF
jgi:hypothetical protein